MWNRTWQTYSSVTQVAYSGAQESTSKWKKKSYFCWWRKSWLFFLITLFMNMKNWTILLFSGSLSKICCTKLDLLQDIQKFYGALFDVHGFLKYERRHQSVAFNSLATQWVFRSSLTTHAGKKKKKEHNLRNKHNLEKKRCKNQNKTKKQHQQQFNNNLKQTVNVYALTGYRMVAARSKKTKKKKKKWKYRFSFTNGTGNVMLFCPASQFTSDTLKVYGIDKLLRT